MLTATQLLDPSHHYLCEHPDCPPDQCKLTWRTESSERYCEAHFPWHNDAERLAATSAVDERQATCSKCGKAITQYDPDGGLWVGDEAGSYDCIETLLGARQLGPRGLHVASDPSGAS